MGQRTEEPIVSGDLLGGPSDVGAESASAPTIIETNVEVQLRERIFCFTGRFDFHPIESLEAEVEDRGGDARGSVTKVVDYLVVGEASRPEVVTTDARVRAARRLQQQGAGIHIVTERQWVAAIARDDAALDAHTTVPSIRAQVWRSLRQQAKESFETERERNPKARRPTVPRPIVRAGRTALCFRDQGFLERVTQYDYDFSNSEFLGFADRRGVLQLAGVRGSRRWEYFAHHNWTREDYLADSHSQLAALHDGQQHRYTDQERESNWGVIAYGRAALQDCWEVFLSVVEDQNRKA